MNIFSKISTFVSFYYFSKCNIYASTLSKGNNLFLLFIFFPILIISRQQFKGMIQIHLPIPPLRVWVLHVFFSSCASLQIIFHAASCKKRLVIPYDGPFKQKCRDAGGLCGGNAGSGAGSKAASYQGHFYIDSRGCQMWGYHSIWRIASACGNVDTSVTVLVGGCRDAVSGVPRSCHGCIGRWFQKISILGYQSFYRKPHMELYVLSVLSPGKNFPDTGRRMKKSDIYQRISGLALDQDIIHIHLRFYKNKGQFLSS